MKENEITEQVQIYLIMISNYQKNKTTVYLDFSDLRIIASLATIEKLKLFSDTLILKTQAPTSQTKQKKKGGK